MALIPVVELGVAEAYELLIVRFGQAGLPPLDAIENEDWGRDFILSRFREIPASALADAGLCWEDDSQWPRPEPGLTGPPPPGPP